MKEKVLEWVKTAKWWHFWNPGSRYGGGVIMGFIVGVFLMLIFN